MRYNFQNSTEIDLDHNDLTEYAKNLYIYKFSLFYGPLEKKFEILSCLEEFFEKPYVDYMCNLIKDGVYGSRLWKDGDTFKYYGKTFSISPFTLYHNVECSACHGTGIIKTEGSDVTHQCEMCDGTGHQKYMSVCDYMTRHVYVPRNHTVKDIISDYDDKFDNYVYPLMHMCTGSTIYLKDHQAYDVVKIITNSSIDDYFLLKNRRTSKKILLNSSDLVENVMKSMYK